MTGALSFIVILLRPLLTTHYSLNKSFPLSAFRFPFFIIFAK